MAEELKVVTLERLAQYDELNKQYIKDNTDIIFVDLSGVINENNTLATLDTALENRGYFNNTGLFHNKIFNIKMDKYTGGDPTNTASIIYQFRIIYKGFTKAYEIRTVEGGTEYTLTDYSDTSIYHLEIKDVDKYVKAGDVSTKMYLHNYIVNANNTNKDVVYFHLYSTSPTLHTLDELYTKYNYKNIRFKWHIITEGTSNFGYFEFKSTYTDALIGQIYTVSSSGITVKEISMTTATATIDGNSEVIEI